ncbi:MAG: hypothetical protein HY787_02925 [Deltaproteobacteria bacterium]|nr:hypothetical protein [Deltaproteobacteria bacterium]
MAVNKKERPDLFLGLIFLVYIMAASIMIQFVILPLVFPEWHGGAGLLSGTDSLANHQIAVGQARRIQLDGWKAWRLSPQGQTSAGIAGAFYAVFTPQPWVLIPLYALLFSGSAYLLLKIYALSEQPIFPGQRPLSVIPFLLFPSSAMIYAQLLKDVFFIFGNLLFLFAWLFWIKKGAKDEKISWGQFGFILVLGLAGYLSAWVVRPYWGPVFFLLALIFFFLIILREIKKLPESRFGKKQMAYLGLSLAVVLAFGLTLQQKRIPDSMMTEAPEQDTAPVELSWKRSNWVPAFLDQRMESLAYSRKAFFVKYPEAGSTIDKDWNFHSAAEMIRYLPRALFIGFFMPTPNLAFQKGVNPGGTAMRRITGMEMVFLYLCYPLVALGLWRWRKKMEMWAFLLWAAGGIILYTLTSPNIGALYRFRYGFIMALAGLGLYSSLAFLSRRKVLPSGP